MQTHHNTNQVCVTLRIFVNNHGMLALMDVKTTQDPYKDPHQFSIICCRSRREMSLCDPPL
jgi:hypothetical protein